MQTQPEMERVLVFKARCCLILASMLWSLSGLFTRLLQTNGDDTPLHPLQMACFRVLFAALGMVVFLRPGQIVFRKPMIVTVICFAVMNALFVTALAMGSAANAILLQYTSLIWFVLFSIFFLRESPDRKTIQSLLPGMIGILVLVIGGWHGGEVSVMMIALGSGVAYAGVIVGLRALRDVAPPWITFLNHGLAGAILLPLVIGMPMPSPREWGILFLFGFFQMGLPYLLTARSLKVLSPQEAGILTLLEPILNPLWAYCVAPEKENWTFSTVLGGGLLMSALVWRYWPGAKNRPTN